MDIVEELRKEANLPHGPNLLLRKAAKEIERLREEILELSERHNNAAKEINRLKGAAGHPKDDGPGG